VGWHGAGELNANSIFCKNSGVIAAEMNVNAIAGYSDRNATIGSTFVARLAGM